MLIRITVEYDGTGYSGWQVQSGQDSIQARIEYALERIFSEQIRVHGAACNVRRITESQNPHVIAPSRINAYCQAGRTITGMLESFANNRDRWRIGHQS